MYERSIYHHVIYIKHSSATRGQSISRNRRLRRHQNRLPPVITHPGSVQYIYREFNITDAYFSSRPMWYGTPHLVYMSFFIFFAYPHQPHMNITRSTTAQPLNYQTSPGIPCFSPLIRAAFLSPSNYALTHFLLSLRSIPLSPPSALSTLEVCVYILARFSSWCVTRCLNRMCVYTRSRRSGWLIRFL